MSTSFKGISVSNDSSKSDYQYPPKPDEYGDVKPPPRRLNVHRAFDSCSATRSAPSITFASKPHLMDWGRCDTEYGPDMGRKEDLIKDAAPSFTMGGREKSNLVQNEWVPGPGAYVPPGDLLTRSHPTVHQDGRGWGLTTSQRPQPRGSDTPAPEVLPPLAANSSWSITSKTDVGSMFDRKSGKTPGPGAYTPSLGGKARNMPEYTFKKNSTRESPIIGFKNIRRDEPGPGAYKAHLGRGDGRRASSWSFGAGGSNRFGKGLPPREY